MIRLNHKTGLAALAGFGGLLVATPAWAEVSAETAYVFNTFSFLVCGALVMWMAAGFAMLESGLVRSKNTATICLKNIALYALAGILYYLIGYHLMYTDVSGWIGSFSSRKAVTTDWASLRETASERTRSLREKRTWGFSRTSLYLEYGLEEEP